MMSGEGVSVEDVMKKNIIKIESTNNIKDAAVKMDDSNIGSIIITKDDVPTGILTERDFVRRVYARDIPLSTPVSEVMSHPLISIDVNETIWDVAELMKKHNIHKIPVTKKEKLVGIVTNTDLVELASLSSDSEVRNICDQIFLRMKG